jgi:hypothetical protein
VNSLIRVGVGTERYDHADLGDNPGVRTNILKSNNVLPSKRAFHPLVGIIYKLAHDIFPYFFLFKTIKRTKISLFANDLTQLW